jgi:hypothetical protein
VRITLKDQVKTVKLAKGDTLEVSLDLSEAKTMWVEEKTPTFLKLVSGPSTRPARKGIPANIILEYLVVGPGADMLTIKLIRPSTPTAPALKQFTVTVSVPK